MGAASVGEQTYEATVSSWAAHLRSGGTTQWTDWVTRDHRDDRSATGPAAPLLHPLPDAVHLELARRTNLAAPTNPAGPAGDRAQGLVDRILSTAAPGRGLVDVPLPWPEAPRRFGTPAVDPARLPEEELIRLAVGVVVHLLPDLSPPSTDPGRRALPLPWRRRFRLHGSPGTAAGIRRALLAQGHRETDWRPVHVVVARPLEVMMAEHWATTAHAGGILKWSTLWRRAEATGGLPDRVDVAALADGLHRRAQRGRRREPVHVVVARDTEDAAALAAQVLHTGPLATHSGGDPAETDLLRRVNRLTALAHGPAQVGELAARLTAALDDLPALTADAPPPVVPAASLAWAREQAASTAERLRAAGYAVHGDLDALAPVDQGLSGAVDRTRTLELAVAACLRTWSLQGGPS